MLEDLTVGPFAHGFGVTGDGRSFAFRTVAGTLTVEIYRPDPATPVPGPDDVAAVATARVTDIDLDDPRSITALVRDLIPVAAGVDRAPGVRALWHRLGSVLDGR
ncbi:hypothetical protein ACWDSJ_32475 [Nocardia sp. NPDC003482]